MLTAEFPVANASNAAFVAGSAGSAHASTVVVVVLVVVVVVVLLVVVVEVVVLVVVVVVLMVVAVVLVVGVDVVMSDSDVVGAGVGDGASPADDSSAHPAMTSDIAIMTPRQATRKGPGCTVATVPGELLRGQVGTSCPP